MCKGKQSWSEQLPIVLLGLRSAHQKDLGCSAAELVFGQVLRLPGEFFDPQPDPISRTEFARQLQEAFAELRPPTTAHHAKTLPTCAPALVLIDPWLIRWLNYHPPIDSNNDPSVRTARSQKGSPKGASHPEDVNAIY
uniref:Uncharacterized protein n=1 Tax=Anopheles atroparvus TaxID=41427 RepID=A0AAG5DMA8_ANOAO